MIRQKGATDVKEFLHISEAAGPFGKNPQYFAACSILWSSKYYMINFTYSQGTHNVKIVGEFAGRPAITEFPDINGDGIIDIYDVVMVCSHYGEKLEEP